MVLRLERNKKEYIGGFFVGSNKQGSEAVGELYSAIIEYIQENGNSPAITDIRAEIAKRLSASLGKEKKNTRYLLNQLTDAGAGHMSAEDMVAIGVLDYTSFEKVPELIRPGATNMDNFQKSKSVINNLTRWLTSNDEKGFKLN